MVNLTKEILKQVDGLERRFSHVLEVNKDFDRKVVSFQANKTLPVFRWYKYKEGFSVALLNYLFKKTGIRKGRIIDPFAGIGTTLFAANVHGINSLGIELLPIGCEVIQTRLDLLKLGKKKAIVAINEWREKKPWLRTNVKDSFSHLGITKGAFPSETEECVRNYLAAVKNESKRVQRILRLALICILEEISYTRKDGQYLRWDSRSGRCAEAKKPFSKGPIPSFSDALERKLQEIIFDLMQVGQNADLFSCVSESGKAAVELKIGSCLDILPTLDSDSFDALITSPPYCNRYDYTRTYALELAVLGVGEDELRNLRQTMLSCTVQNREKEKLKILYGEKYLKRINEIFNSQKALQSILIYLEACKKEKLINNPGIVQMVRNYFYEMTIWISECRRILKPNAPLIMVNDNVCYQGIGIPVDCILSDFAEKIGFKVEKIWVLPVGKGNSSQQMGKHGRQELRKCVYFWRAPKEKLAKKLNH